MYKEARPSAYDFLAWEKKFQLAPHYVYLANSSGIKVGITRESQGEKRWMDQGASQAILLAEVPNRRFSVSISGSYCSLPAS